MRPVDYQRCINGTCSIKEQKALVNARLSVHSQLSKHAQLRDEEPLYLYLHVPGEGYKEVFTDELGRLGWYWREAKDERTIEVQSKPFERDQ